jgi:hypothetical protein
VRAFLVIALVLLAAPAAAHRSSMSYFTVQVEPEGVDLTVQLAAGDLFEALGLDRERDATEAEILAGQARLSDYVESRVTVQGCDLGPATVDVVTQADRFARLRFQARCTIDVLVRESRLFFDLDPAHVGRVEIQAGGRHTSRELRARSPRLEWDVRTDDRQALGTVAFVAEGVRHIAIGLDHIAFVIALLLACVLGTGDQPRRTRDAVISVLKTVTAFTVAHSLTLIAAALGWITLPSRLVEIVIAASIVSVAVDNLVRRTAGQRWPLALGFGLVHGLGFASVLAPLLPPADRVGPLLAFNVGVELGQLVIVAVLLPLFLLVAHRAGGPFYRRWVLGMGSVLVGVLGLLWLLERVLDLKILPALG